MKCGRVVAQNMSHWKINSAMKQMDRIYKIDALLANGRSRSIEFLLDELEISRVTFKRDIAVINNRLNGSILWDAGRAGEGMIAQISVDRHDCWRALVYSK